MATHSTQKISLKFFFNNSFIKILIYYYFLILDGGYSLFNQQKVKKAC